MAQSALVTGATGLVGSHIVERLHRDGWRVRALVRDAERARWLARLGAELVTGDVMDAESVRRAARGTDALFHTAAAIMPRGGWAAYRAPNVEGTGNVIEAASIAGSRLVHLSSVAVYGPSRYRGDGAPTDEDTALRPLPPAQWYARSKRESESLVMNAQRVGRIWATAIRPCVIYGRRDRQFVPRVARLLSRGFAPALRGGRAIFSIVHASNVAEAAILAASHDVANGAAYNAANDHAVTVREFVTLASEGLEQRVRLVPVPLGLARFGARVVTRAARLLGKGGSFTPSASVDFLSRDNPFSSERVRRELGWNPSVTPREGVPDAFRWWRLTGGNPGNDEGAVE